MIISLLGLVSCAESRTQVAKIEKKELEVSIIILQGKISMKGSSLISYLSISDITSGKSYKISNPTTFNLSDKQNYTLSIKAKLIKKSVGPGFPAIIEVIEIL